jgi:hypothetical protein
MIALVLVLLLLARPAFPQGTDGGVYWHISPGVKTCSMVIDPSLTQGQWHTFVRQAGALIDFKSLAPASPLGKNRFNLGVVYSLTPVNQHDPAWINTFTHPDADCPLGDQIAMPSLRATWGASDAMDVTGFWTQAPGANYGLAGGAMQYTFLRESAKGPAAAASVAFTSLTGVADFDFYVMSFRLSASKRLARFTPYLGVKQGVALGVEQTPKVDLKRETVPLAMAVVGTTWSIWKLGVAAEYEIADVNTFALQLGFRP